MTALEAVYADGILFPSYLIGKGATGIFDWHKHVTAGDKEARWALLQRVGQTVKLETAGLCLCQLQLPTTASRVVARNHTEGSALENAPYTM